MGTLKVCYKCLLPKPLDEFYSHREMKDGTLNKCKACCKADIKKNYETKILNPLFVINERTRGRKKYHRLYSGIQKSKPGNAQKHIRRYPEKRLAISASSRIKSHGLERHHWSYKKEHQLDAILLSKKEHMKAHRFLRYDEREFMYRRYDTNELLCTRELHEKFIHDCIVNEEN